MKTFKCLGIGIVGLFFSACMVCDNFAERGSGRMTTEQRSLSGISGISLHTSGELFIEVGNKESLRIEADDNLIPYIQTDVRDGTLTIRTGQPGYLHFTRAARYYLTVKSLNSIAIYSSGNIQAPDLKADRFFIGVSSSGNLRMGNLQTDALTVNISSSGDVALGGLNAGMLEINISSSGDLNIGGGEVKRQNIVLSSSGDYKGQNLASDEANLTLNSSGDAAIRVRNQLTADLRSSGDLRYLGNPTVNLNQGSSGEITRMGD